MQSLNQDKKNESFQALFAAVIGQALKDSAKDGNSSAYGDRKGWIDKETERLKGKALTFLSGEGSSRLKDFCLWFDLDFKDVKHNLKTKR